jgi:hypothetical protein
MDAGKTSQRRRAGCSVETSLYRRAVLTIASAATDNTRANMTFAPKWNWRSRSFVSVSIIFWLLFTAATVFLAATVIHQIVKGDSSSSMAGLILVTCMAIGSLVWALGLAKLVGVSYHVHADGPFLVWRELQFDKHREKKIDLSTIISFEAAGSPSIGYSLQLRTRVKTHRLGSLLSMKDIRQLSKFIEQSNADQTNAGNRCSPGV